jgi:predicted nucleotidyltransferase
MLTNLHLDEASVTEFCRRHHLLRLAFFGSVLRDDFAENSDVDVLVEYSPGHVPGFIALTGMEEELSAILGRKADIRSAGDLSRHIRDDVVREALVQYVA